MKRTASQRTTLAGTFAVLLGLALGATATPAADHSITAPNHLLAMEVPAPTPPIDPAKEPNSPWDDTADTSEEMRNSLQIDADSDREVHLETDLRNGVHSPLLENDQVDPADSVPDIAPFDEHDPMVDPSPR